MLTMLSTKKLNKNRSRKLPAKSALAID